MLVIAILAIVTALAIPQAGADSVRRLESAAAILAAELDQARLDSIAHGDDPRVVVFDTAAHAYHVAAASAPATPLKHPTQGTPNAMAFGDGLYHNCPGVTLGTLSLDGDTTLGFDAFGSLDQATSATIQLRADVHSVTLTLDSATGEVTITGVQ